MHSTADLWRNRPFLLFATARLISITGSILTSVVLPILVFQLTGSALRTSLLASLNVVPYLAFGLFAGVLADRTDRRRLMIACDLINTALLASIPVAAALGLLSVAQIYSVALLSASAFVWFDAANFGLLPALVGRSNVLAANSFLWSASTLVEVIIPSVGGLIATTLGAANAIALDAASYLVSALLLLLIGRALVNLTVNEPPEQAASATQSWRDEIGAGIRFIWQQRLVRTLTLLGFGHSFTSGAVYGLLVVFGVRGLGLADNDARLGWLFTAGAIGALIASTLLPWLTRRLAIARITLFSLAADLLALLTFIAADRLWLALICYALWNTFHTLVVINGISLRQMVTPSHLLGRVNTTARMVAWGGAPFGAALGGLLAEWTDIHTTYLLMASGVAISALLGWFSPLREGREG